ncbi:50S ribosomal protein L25/general stress protein Ctc [Marinibactrum halimedae]|uniref:Large ribosomal subunit protein bL25 n=1 Tax=Marinibactrum halimedae TaxID=1444977 RepID=A0AA37T1R9_9GAMM|nr:50S ribosomal protein L25/general stress protein Ctc [Marinibactrum halimedae]MCD9457447.1 50S ribosomal protein L25/general stress protein Ctc [Marinibactrum halimedae]GLS25500.1 50S ribosomal protein L25 [Marinibactrum halimedae]
MSEDFTLNAELRSDAGKGASRRLRREENKVPAIIYGGEKAPQNITVLQKDIIKQLENEAFYSHIITLNVGDDSEQVILKDLQRHPAKALILHADFLRVDASKLLTTKVPLHFLNEETCPGVKLQGGKVSHSVTELEVSCLPSNLPEFIEVDLAEVEVGQTIHISDLKLPSGVSSVELAHDHDLGVVSITKPKGSSSDEESSEGEAAE